MAIPTAISDSPPPRHEETVGRGRPAMHENRTVAEDIMRAALACLEKRSPQQLTIKEVALKAGTRPAMVYYYFGGMEGLLHGVLRQSLKEVQSDILGMRTAILRNQVEKPLRSMIAMFAAAYNQRPALMRILISEILQENSAIRSFFVSEWPAYGKLMMDDVIRYLSESGHYRKDVNVEGIGAMIRSVVVFPLIIKPYLAREGEMIEHYLDDEWIDFVTTVFECYLRRPE